MAARRATVRQETQEMDLPSPARPALVEGGVYDPAGAHGNPARDLQREIAAAAAKGAFGAAGHDVVVGDRWSQRRTLMFIVATCGAFWAAVAFAMSRLF